MIEGRRQAARRRRDAALAAFALTLLVSAVAVALMRASAGAGDPAAYRAGMLALGGWAIAIGLAYIYDPRR